MDTNKFYVLLQFKEIVDKDLNSWVGTVNYQELLTQIASEAACGK